MDGYSPYFYKNGRVDDLSRFFTQKANQPRLKILNNLETRLYEDLDVLSRKYNGLSKESLEYNVLKSEECELRQELLKICNEEIELNAHCPAWLESVDSDDFLMSELISKLFSNSQTLKISENELYKYAEDIFGKITKGGYFQEESLLRYGNPCIEKLTKWFTESDDLYEFEKDDTIPTRLNYDGQLLSFPWYKEKDEIISCGEELVRLKTIVENNKTLVLGSVNDLIIHIKDTYFSTVDIFTIATEINDVYDIFEKKNRLDSLYRDCVLCPTDMHKVLLSLFVDPFGIQTGVLIMSVV